MSERTTRITVLVENTANQGNLLAEHGLAFCIERDRKRVLFDTGQGMVLQHNAKALGIDLAATDDVVLSHGHYDHTGGLFWGLTHFGRSKVYAHQEAFCDRFVRESSGHGRSVRSPIESWDLLKSRVEEVIPTGDASVMLGGGLWLTGEIPRRNDYEDTGGAFYLDEACTQADSLVDDQAMFLETSRGLVVLLGCAHAGVVNTLEHIRTLTGQAPIYAVFGGMHLLAADEDRLVRTVQKLLSLNVQKIGLAHCTGFSAMARLYAELPGRCFHCVAGTRMAFE